MDDLNHRLRKILLLRGAIALLFGILALVWPGLTLLWLVALFAAYALLGGAASVVGAMRARKRHPDWWLFLAWGLVSIGAGAVAVLNPALTALVLVLLMGANALVTGVLDIAIAIRWRSPLHPGWPLVLAGVVSIAFGVMVFLYPGAGALALVWLISFQAILVGVLLLGAAFKSRGETGAHMAHGTA